MRHGTYSGYTGGCHCVACQDAAARYRRAFRERKREDHHADALLGDLLDELFPAGLTTPAERLIHGEMAA